MEKPIFIKVHENHDETISDMYIPLSAIHELYVIKFRNNEYGLVAETPPRGNKIIYKGTYEECYMKQQIILRKSAQVIL